MKTALDSSVILDVVINDAAFASTSEAAIREAAGKGTLIIGECVLVEISPAFAEGEIAAFLADWQIQFQPSSQESALFAGQIFKQYLQRKGQPRRVVPDFLIAAHAREHADRLLARDRGYYRDYFKDLVLMEPSKPTGR